MDCRDDSISQAPCLLGIYPSKRETFLPGMKRERSRKGLVGRGARKPDVAKSGKSNQIDQTISDHLR